MLLVPDKRPLIQTNVKIMDFNNSQKRVKRVRLTIYCNGGVRHTGRLSLPLVNKDL